MKNKSLELKTERLGPLPLINHFIERLGIAPLLRHFVPTRNPRCRLDYDKGLGVLLRSIMTEREPIYRLGEMVHSFAPKEFALTATQANNLKDDAVGRALDHLFDADRATLLTEIVLQAQKEFAISLDELHNDSTTVKFVGRYTEAKGRSLRGKKGPYITYGFSKDHRPDLKQLLFILTATSDGAVPIQFRCEAGNQNDSRTHEQTWDALCQVAGRKDFLYVADSKLCNAEAMEYIDRRKGRFVTVLPKNRSEDKEFRQWIQDHQPAWEKIWDRENPRKKWGIRDRWYAIKYDLPSQEGWPVIWVYSTLLRLKQTQSRNDRISRAKQDLQDLAAQHLGPRPRKRARCEVYKQVQDILEPLHVKRYIQVRIKRVGQHHFKQTHRGRPGASTQYVRKTKYRWQINWDIDESTIAYDHQSDGMYPLLTNDRSLTPKQVLEAHKRQPCIEKRFEQIKTVLEIAPVLLKNEGRIEGLFFLYFIALLLEALIEREIRMSMQREKITDLPLYPEERANAHPTTEQMFRLFSLLERHRLYDEAGCEIQVFDPKFSGIQKEVLRLLKVPGNVYTGYR
jgi:transposase